MQRRLAERGIDTIGQLAASPHNALQSALGCALGTKVGALATNDDQRRRPADRPRRIGRSAVSLRAAGHLA